MCGQEMVTEFGVTKDTPVKELITALTAHLKTMDLEPDEYGFNVSFLDDGSTIGTYRWLIAFAVEGTSEGYYVHVGSLYKGEYLDFGLAKTYSPENAYALAREAQRFLTAAQWN
jgi:hypothetical protein